MRGKNLVHASLHGPIIRARNSRRSEHAEHGFALRIQVVTRNVEQNQVASFAQTAGYRVWRFAVPYGRWRVNQKLGPRSGDGRQAKRYPPSSLVEQIPRVTVAMQAF